jgi:hypothetical protein
VAENEDSSNKSQMMDGQPWWVRAVALVGFPVVVAGVLVYVLLADLRGEVRQQTRDTASILTFIKADNEQRWFTISLQQKVCIRLSNTAAERQDCLTLTQPPRLGGGQ